MKRIFLSFLLLAAILNSCSDSNDQPNLDAEAGMQNACTAEDPLQLPWMQDLVEELDCGKYSCKVSILKSEYNGETVFYTKMTDPLCNGVNEIDLYNCFGKKIEDFTIEQSREFLNNQNEALEELFSCNG